MYEAVLNNNWDGSVSMKKESAYAKYMKRILDIVFAIIILLAFWWIYLILAILVRVKLGAPVIFKQERLGKNNKPFMLYKFRTMTNATDKTGQLLPATERITKFGATLRSTSFDELPELINILKGDMSFIGPRPLPTRYLTYYTEEELHRHDVRPGLSGYAQVEGRSFITWEEKFKLDVQYTRKCCFTMDVRIILSSLKKIFSRKDVADFSKVEKDENGLLWITIDGVRKPIHRPLDVERA